MSCVSKRGIVPNPSFTPLCYQVFCGEGPRDKGAALENAAEDAEPAPDLFALYLAKFRDDAANLSSIEALCGPGK